MTVARTSDERYAAQEGTWTLTAPDGRKWQADSPLRVVSLEQRQRVPAEVALHRIFKEADRWCEGIIELKRDGDYLVVSVERKGTYVEVIRTSEPDRAPIGHAVHPAGIDVALEKAGLL
jgi:hypothetical protein